MGGVQILANLMIVETEICEDYALAAISTQTDHTDPTKSHVMRNTKFHEINLLINFSLR
jgi:hypothetical protein